MKLRSSLLLAPLVAGLSLGVLAPARADVVDPIALQQPVAVQTSGAHDRWTISASWTPNGASSYSVVVTDTDDVTLAAKAVATSPASLTTDALLGDHDYLLRVKPEGGNAETLPFHTPVLDTTGPTGTYTVDRAAAYLTTDLLSQEDSTASFRITQTSLDESATRQVLAGDGTAAKSWTSTGSYTLTYTKVGTYIPHVILTDRFGNANDVPLPAIHVIKDEIAPTVAITTPARSNRVRSWRTIHGTASDGQTGLAAVIAFVMEKRGATWWAYDFDKHTWLKGYTSRQKTESKTKASGAFILVTAAGTWKSPAVRSIAKGTLYVQAAAFDNEFNVSLARPVTRKVH